ncbi:MAG: decarboxylase [Candidatus Omnitrophica bacterium]|nr:decarboxylase [Candidatus Omnitrophota bacterium]MBU1128280.1 decarboxylase [Candidatus Omnitrophota bacterium]MBU1657310.1 decarboxylase [Candidatus Omnitrophota bacterium]MBU1784035.1 decarboxylase [Candidatus Omnitrophota bacterium]MBU1851030.1 decarboxylase [Candidatus Omnitrophota bacterium]
MDDQQYLNKARDILRTRTPLIDKGRLRSFVDEFIKDRQRYQEAHDRAGSPLYLFDERALIRKAKEFRNAFHSEFPRVSIFYALKSNSHPFIMESLINEGYGIDVSSGKELEQALRYSPAKIIFSGPGKTLEELCLACGNADTVTVLLDSFGELSRLGETASGKDVRIKAGVRLMIEEKGLWRKFGILLSDIERFFDEAKKYPNVELCGLQFHSSWNLDAGKQTDFISRLGRVLAQMNRDVLQKINFIDIGGGYWPVQGEWIQPCATQEGRLKQCIEPGIPEGMEHYGISSAPIGEFARRLAKALEEHVLKYVDCTIYLEPGRWISHEAMHILVKVVDKKAYDTVICDGGTNMIGWERYETDYFPVINLSQPSLDEHPCMIFGSLCTPHDLWGYSYFGSDIGPGDILLIPMQGAYTYSLRQEFIKPIPPVHRLQ